MRSFFGTVDTIVCVVLPDDSDEEELSLSTAEVLLSDDMLLVLSFLDEFELALPFSPHPTKRFNAIYIQIADIMCFFDIFNDIDKCDCFVETVVLNSADMGFGTDPAKGMDFFMVSVEEFQRVFETNLVWNFTIVRQAAIRMKEHHKGAIVFFSSNTAYRAIPNRSDYSASKGGINAMPKAFAIDLGPYGIRSNVVLPGTIKTARWVEMGNKQIVNGTLTPMGDISDFEDIANAAFYLGTDLSKNVTGTEITVDGGMSCQLYPQLLNGLKKKAQNNF